jgi:hypothetical protein
MAVRLSSVAVFVVLYMVLAAAWDMLDTDKSFGHGLVSNIVPGLIIGVVTFLVLPEVALRWRRSRERRRPAG